MTWFPVVEREMRVAARRAATYRIRFWAVLVLLGVFALFMMDESNYRANSSQAGRELLGRLSLLAFVFTMLIGVVATSDSVSEEKREGTLGLLFLTDLKGFDVVLGKLVAHSINAFYALVAIMPILGMPLLMGGENLLQFAKIIVALVSAIIFSLAAGIFVSTHSHNERKALVFTFLLLAAVTCVPFVLMFWLSEGLKLFSDRHVWKGLMFSPGFAVGMAFDTPSMWPAASYWYSVVLTWLGAIALFLNAAKTAPRSWTETGPKPARRRFASSGSDSAKVKMRRGQLLSDNPFLWLALRGEASQGRVWLFVLSILVIWGLFWMRLGSFVWSAGIVLPTVAIVHVGLKIWMVGEASRRFVEDRRNNAMEFLLSTPLNERQIIRGQWRALLRQFLWPIVAVLLWEIVMAVAIYHARDSFNDNSAHDKLAQLLCAMFFLPMDFLALGSAGMWLGMTSKGRGRAMLFGFALVVILPFVLAQIVTVAGQELGFQNSLSLGPREMEILTTVIFACISLMTDAVVIIWSGSRLLTNFRRLAVGGGSQ